jgi:site-specific DNA recombinase
MHLPASCARLLGHKGFAKQYLRMLVTEIRVKGDQLRVSESNSALGQEVAQMEMGTPYGVPTFASDWLPDLGSNQGPAD